MNIRFFTILILISLMVSPVSHAREKELNYRLKWLFNTSVAGDIWADANGYFTKAGLTVTLKEGSPEKNAINELELGYADFGVASADQVIRALDKGADVKVVAQLFQINPMQWIYRTTQPEIKQLEDLKGRTIGITFGGNDETIMRTLFAKAGITEKDVAIVGVRFDFTPFYTKAVEVWPVYRNSQGVILENRLAKENESVYFFNPADFGVNFVANSIVTSGKMIQRHPGLVTDFLTALLSAWESAMDPDNAASVLAVIKQFETGADDNILRQQLEATRKLVKPASSVKIGTIDRAAWKQTEAIMLREGQIKKPVQIETCLVTAE